MRRSGRGEPGQGEPLGARHQVIRLQACPVVGDLPPLVARLRSSMSQSEASLSDCAGQTQQAPARMKTQHGRLLKQAAKISQIASGKPWQC